MEIKKAKVNKRRHKAPSRGERSAGCNQRAAGAGLSHSLIRRVITIFPALGLRAARNVLSTFILLIPQTQRLLNGDCYNIADTRQFGAASEFEWAPQKERCPNRCDIATAATSPGPGAELRGIWGYFGAFRGIFAPNPSPLLLVPCFLSAAGGIFGNTSPELLPRAPCVIHEKIPACRAAAPTERPDPLSERC